MLKFVKWGAMRTKKLTQPQRNLAGQIISAGEIVKVSRSKEDPFLIDIVSVSKPKRIVRNVSINCTEPVS